MNSQLERISNEICINHVRVMRNLVLSEEDLHCRNGCDGFYFDCDNYKGVKNTGVRFSHLRLYSGGLGI